MAIPKELLQQLLKDYKNLEDLLGENGLLKELTKGLMEAALGAELSEHLGYEKHETTDKPTENRWNGASKKTIRTDQGEVNRLESLFSFYCFDTFRWSLSIKVF